MQTAREFRQKIFEQSYFAFVANAYTKLALFPARILSGSAPPIAEDIARLGCIPAEILHEKVCRRALFETADDGCFSFSEGSRKTAFSVNNGCLIRHHALRLRGFLLAAAWDAAGFR